MSQRTANAIARYAVAVAALLVLLVIAQPAEARYSDGMNMYEYVQTNPIRYRDPMGQLLEEDPPQHVAPADDGDGPTNIWGWDKEGIKGSLEGRKKSRALCWAKATEELRKMQAALEAAGTIGGPYGKAASEMIKCSGPWVRVDEIFLIQAGYLWNDVWSGALISHERHVMPHFEQKWGMHNGTGRGRWSISLRVDAKVTCGFTCECKKDFKYRDLAPHIPEDSPLNQNVLKLSMEGGYAVETVDMTYYFRHRPGNRRTFEDQMKAIGHPVSNPQWRHPDAARYKAPPRITDRFTWDPIDALTMVLIDPSVEQQ